MTFSNAIRYTVNAPGTAAPAVLHGDDLNSVIDDAVINDVGKAIKSRTADVLILRGVKLWVVAYTVRHLIHGRSKFAAQSQTLPFVPSAPFSQILFRFRKDMRGRLVFLPAAAPVPLPKAGRPTGPHPRRRAGGRVPVDDFREFSSLSMGVMSYPRFPQMS